MLVRHSWYWWHATLVAVHWFQMIVGRSLPVPAAQLSDFQGAVLQPHNWDEWRCVGDAWSPHAQPLHPAALLLSPADIAGSYPTMVPDAEVLKVGQAARSTCFLFASGMRFCICMPCAHSCPVGQLTRASR